MVKTYAVTARTTLVLAALLVLAGCARSDTAPAPAPARSASPAAATIPTASPRVVERPRDASYVGADACISCHQTEVERWRGSHHALAMQPATPSTVRGNFQHATFTKDGITSTFFRRDDAFFVRTDGADGKLADYHIAYTFGVDPLQQYLVEFPGGRYQALGIAWDTRSAGAGGQRWFHLYPKERIDHRDQLHWTGAQQNWNFMCAECHSTNLQKGYSEADDRFATTWSDVNVACEACHGPGSRHVAWAEAVRDGHPDADPLRGLVFQLRDTSGGQWSVVPGAFIAQRTKARTSEAELETCGRCHARAARIWGEHHPGEPLEQTHRVALLDEGLYEVDGQVRDEVYEDGSFLQSKMRAAGVACTDCHDPHSGALRASGNALCAKCHVPAHFDTRDHYFHEPGTQGAQCVSCHMAERLYMVVDGRRDHSFRLPRPDLSERLGTPNACNGCHSDKSPRWAADAIAQRYGATTRAPVPWVEALQAGRTARIDAESQLVRAIEDGAAPAIARASAVSLLARYLSPSSVPALRRAAQDRDPLVRRAAAETLGSLPPEERVPLATPLLDDPIRSVRLEALGSFLDVPPSSLSSEQRAALDAAIHEYRRAQAFNADRAEARANLGVLESRLDNATAAQAAFDAAIRLQPSFSPAYVELADLLRRQDRESDAEALLRRGLKESPEDGALHEALGLSLVRQHRLSDALSELARAAELAPDTPRYAYVHAVALHDTGDLSGAIAALTKAHERHPGVHDLVFVLVQYEVEAGDRAAAIAWARGLAGTWDDPRARQLVERLEAGK